MNLDVLLASVTAEIQETGIPTSQKIDPHVRINSRAVRRFGRCIREGDRYCIELSARLLSGSESACRTVLAHELLHTCAGCMNHGTRWKRYAARIQAALGYEVTRSATDTALGTEPPAAKYQIICSSCGRVLLRYRASPLTRNPERYRCRCGGTLFLKEGA